MATLDAIENNVGIDIRARVVDCFPNFSTHHLI